MPIKNVEQPEYIVVSDDIRLRKFDNIYDFALEWYQDEETKIGYRYRLNLI